MIKREDILSLLGEVLNQIVSNELREQVLRTWLEACHEGNWENISQLVEMPFTLLTNTRGINFIEHTLAVTEGALALAEAQANYYAKMPYEINRDWLIAGGLLHDVGKLLEFQYDPAEGYRKSYYGKCARHPISGAIIAAKNGLPMEVVNMIGCHAKEGDGRPKRIETVLIHQADFATFDPMVMLEKGILIV